MVFNMSKPKKILLRVRNLKKWFPANNGWVKAVDDVTFDIYVGEMVGLVGESGCGKTTLSRMILGLEKATDGNVLLNNKSLFKMDKYERRRLSEKIQMVFQDPYSSLDPKMTVGQIIEEPLIANGYNSKHLREERVDEMIDVVELPKDSKNRRPSDFSGGQRQRVCIARALSVNPEFLICDEPVSALDVSIRSQILNLLLHLQKQFGLTTLFISHDLSVVEYVCDRIIVMYLGKIMEIASKEDLYENPAHPYTRALMSAIPIPDPDVNMSPEILEGDLPSPLNPPSGCRFKTRCPMACEKCNEEPPMRYLGDNHFCACHFAEENMRRGKVKND